MAPSLSADTAANLRRVIDDKTSGPEPSIPGFIYQAIDRDGQVLFNHASGSRGLGHTEPMTFETTFWLASFTKLITSIACMQLVEQQKLQLDCPETIARFAPELTEVKVLERLPQGGFTLVQPRKAITLRMLMTHTAGFGYAFEDFKLRDWARPVGLDDFSGLRTDILHRPLVNHPDVKFQYGTSLDWVGIILERASGWSLEDYFQAKILHPLGISNITFLPNADQLSRLAYMHQRAPDGTLQLTDTLFRVPLVANKESKDPFFMGGCGCFGSPIEFCEILATLLNDGISPKTNAKILNPETVAEMFTDQIPDKPRPCDEEWPAAKPWLANGTPLVPVPAGLTEGWGLSFSLSHVKSDSGRSAGTASWEGMANLFWFADRSTGVAGIAASQILPYGDMEVLQLMEAVETKIYEAVAASP